MTRPQSATPGRQHQRPSSTIPAFLVGIPLATAVLCLIWFGPVPEEARRYVSHPAECAEVVLFCCALGALGAKLARSWTERAAFHADVLPLWNGQPVSAGEANGLRARLDRLSQRLQGTFLVSRVAGVLDFLSSRGSAQELDDQLRALADNDALALEGSYALTRFITWAIPILGFLGTVLGITQAIAGVNPDVLEKDLSRVTDGLAQAFDTTALGLALTMITMFISFIVERAEQGVLEAVDRFVDRQLAHRFERMGAEGGEFIAVVRRNTQVLVDAMAQLVRQQAEVWAKAQEEAGRARAEVESRQQHQVSTALEAALERTLDSHARRLAALEAQAVSRGSELLGRVESLAAGIRDSTREYQAGLAGITQGLTCQTEALTQLQEGELQLLRLQEVLRQNLAALAGATDFDQAVHSLTAAIHLLTSRAGEVSSAGRVGRLGQGPGAAA